MVWLRYANTSSQRCRLLLNASCRIVDIDPDGLYLFLYVKFEIFTSLITKNFYFLEWTPCAGATRWRYESEDRGFDSRCCHWNFRWHNPSGRTMSLGLTQPLTEMSKKKSKAIPLQAWSGPVGSRKLRFADFVTTAQDGGKVFSLTHRPPLPPGNTPGTHFC